MARPKKGEPVQKDVVFELLPAAVAKSTGDGELESNLRGVYYVVRPDFERVFGRELNYDTFANIVTAYENEFGEIEGMYRDDRGTFYTPHGDAIPLGTRAVRAYQRPEWTFNKIIYIEKGSHVNLLRQAGWCERNDCAILTSQGFTTRAVRDLFDLLGETGEELTFFCIHDADGPGSMIYQTLVEETKARPGRKVRVINLGLDPEEALAMGLLSESVDSKKRVPVADYLSGYWREWLQSNRVELNAMTSPQFIRWLDSKLAVYPGKVIPPKDVQDEILEDEVQTGARMRAASVVRERLDFDRLVEEEAEKTIERIAAYCERVGGVPLGKYIREHLEANPENRWTDAVDEAVAVLLDGGEIQ